MREVVEAMTSMDLLDMACGARGMAFSFWILFLAITWKFLEANMYPESSRTPADAKSLGKAHILIFLLGFLPHSIFLFQDHFLYHTEHLEGLPEIPVIPSHVTVPLNNLTSADGIPLHGLWLASRATFAAEEHPPASMALEALPERGAPVLLWVPDPDTHLSERLARLPLLAGLAMDVVLFDYRGTGLSAGSFDSRAMPADLDGVWNKLTKDHALSPGSIILYGEGTGAWPAAALALRHTQNIGGLVLEAPAASLVDQIENYIPFLGRLIVRIDTPVLPSAEKYLGPLLLFHRADASRGTIEENRTIFASVRTSRKLFVELAPATSGTPFWKQPAWQTGWERFLKIRSE